MSIVKFLYFGTPEFSRIVLEELLKSGLKPDLVRPRTVSDGLAHIGFKPAAVVTAPDKPVGRKQVLTESPVAAFAKENGIEVLKPEKIRPPEFVEQLRSFAPDLIVVAAYGKIIPQAILDIPKHGNINVHPSLLPKWRGASPIPYTILNGDSKTGVTIMLMDEEMDHGSILAQEEVELRGDETTTTLTPKLARIGGRMLAEIIPRWVAGKSMPREQDHSAATYTKILTKEDGRIVWTKSAVEIERQIRAFDPWPGAWTIWDRAGQELIVKLLEVRVRRFDSPPHHSERRDAGRPEVKNLETRGDSSPLTRLVVQNDETNVPGSVTPEGIVTGNGLLEPLRVQLSGKRAMSWSEFCRGHKDFVGSVLHKTRKTDTTF